MTIIAPVTTTTPPSAPATFESALDAMFARDAASTSNDAPATSTAASEAPQEAEGSTTGGDQPVEEGEAQTEQSNEQPPPVPAPTVSASDYALKLKRLKNQSVKAAPAAPQGPSPEAVKRAQAIEAAGGDPLKAIAALGIDIPTLLKAHDAAQAEDPESHDPAMREIAQLKKKLADREAREAKAEIDQAYVGFHATAKDVMQKSGDAYEYTAAKGNEGLALVTSLVVGAAETGEVLSLHDALRMSEEHFEAEAALLASTKKHQKRYAPPPARKPSIGTNPVLSGKAPERIEKPKSVSQALDVMLEGMGIK